MHSKSIGKILRELREERGQTKKFVSRKIGKSYASVCAWESGDRFPNDEAKVLLAKHYGVPITIFFPDENNET